MLTLELAGNADIEKLQQQLNAWAKLKGGIQVQVTGQLDALTLLASIQVIPQVANEIPVVGGTLKAIISPIKSILSSLGGYSVAAMGLLKSTMPDLYGQIETQVGSGAGYVASGIQKVIALTSTGTTVPTPPGGPVNYSALVKQAYRVKYQPGAGRFPAGTIHYFNAKKKKFVVAVPQLDGAFQGLGAYGEPLGAGYKKEETTTDPTPRGSTLSTENVVEGKFPFYKKWWFWAGLGVGVGAIGGGTWYFVRRKA